jgi:hypothetical protein
MAAPRYEDVHPAAARDACFNMVADALYGTEQKYWESRGTLVVSAAWSLTMLYHVPVEWQIKALFLAAYMLIFTTATDLSKTARDGVQASNGVRHGVYDLSMADAIRGSGENAVKVWVMFALSAAFFCGVLIKMDVALQTKGSFLVTGFLLTKAAFDQSTTIRNRAEAILWRAKYAAAQLAAPDPPR